jgi:hypothetical protein
LATALRFHHLEVQSFWNDEGNSARLSERPIPAIIEGTASDVHPPLYYLALRGWRELAGETEFGLRSFSVFAGVLTVAATMALGWRIGGAGIGLLAGFLAAVNPALVYYSQEARMYALLALLGVLSTLILLIWFGRFPGRGWQKWAIAYVLLAAAGLYTHYFFPAVLLAHNLFFIDWLLRNSQSLQRNKDSKIFRHGIITWVAVMGATLLLYAPWLPVFWRQVGGRTGMRQPVRLFVEESGRWLGFGATVAPETVGWSLAAVTVLAVMGIIVGRRRAFVPLVGAAVPLTFLYVSAATDPAFFKFLLVAVPFVCLLLGLNWLWVGRIYPSSFALVRQRPIKLTIGAVIVVLAMVMLWGSAQSLNNQYTNIPPYTRADYRGMAARITAERHPNAAILLNGPNQWEVFTYYYRGDAPVYPLPLGQPDPAILEPELRTIAERHDRLYALFWGDTQRDPERVIESWLDSHAFKASEEWVGDVRFVVYGLDGAAENLNPIDVSFAMPEGGQIHLTAHSGLPEQVRPGDILPVTLVWEADSVPQQRYKVFLHLVGEDGLPVAQRDSEPVGGLRPTTAWVADESITDNHGLLLPADLLPGRYRLFVGWYDLLDPNARLLTTYGSDAFALTTLEVSQ